MIPDTAAITLRPAYPADYPALARLAALDSAERIPPMPLLLALIDGEIGVALSLADRSVIADPFTPTAAIVELLRRRARATEAHAGANRGGRRLGRRWRARLRLQHA